VHFHHFIVPADHYPHKTSKHHIARFTNPYTRKGERAKWLTFHEYLNRLLLKPKREKRENGTLKL
jgi:hypothetical protein